MTRRIPSPWGWISPHGHRYRLRGRVDGVLRSCGVYASIAEAQQAARAFAEELGAQSGGVSVGSWVVDWLEQREATRRHRSTADLAATWRRYGAEHRIARLAVREVRDRHVRQWVADLERRRVERGPRAGEPLREQTLRNALQVLSQAMAAACVAGLRSGNPCAGIGVHRLARDAEPWTYLSTAEITQLLGCPALPAMQRSAFTVAIYAGLRAGELWGLQWSDVHLDGPRPRVVVRYGAKGAPTKGGRVREVPLLPPALAALRAWRDRDGVTRATGLVWPGERGPHARGYDAGWRRRSERVDGVRESLPGWREVAGIRDGVRLHDLRHTCAAHLVSGSWGRAWRLEEVQRVLGHASRTTTERYAHLAPGALHDAADEARAAWRGPERVTQRAIRTLSP